MIGVDPALQVVLGIAFYEHVETPGLGGRITEPWFQEQFKGKELQPLEEGQEYFYLRAPGTAQAENEVDAISGASETTRRLQVFLNENLKEYLAWLKNQQGVGKTPTTAKMIQQGRSNTI
jgi:Na+-transporting NADH:ubiquinone oxidoreductase subunit C